MKASSHTLDRLRVDFDAPGLVANAGLVLPATLAQRLGLPELLRQHVHLGKVVGAANPERRSLTLIASLLAGGECVDDVNVLRAGRMSAEVLGVRPAAASTVGTFLRAFTSGHARQLDAVQEDLHQRAWAVGARPAGRVVKLDLDSTVIETYGLQKQGGSGFTYLNMRGYHPLLAVIAETGEVVHSRLREGKASSGRGASSFAPRRWWGPARRTALASRSRSGCRRATTSSSPLFQRRSGSPSPTGWRAPPMWPRFPTGPSARSRPTG